VAEPEVEKEKTLERGANPRRPVFTLVFTALALRTRAPPLGVRALLPVARCRSSGSLGALLSSPALDVRLPTALQVGSKFRPKREQRQPRVTRSHVRIRAHEVRPANCNGTMPAHQHPSFESRPRPSLGRRGAPRHLEGTRRRRRSRRRRGVRSDDGIARRKRGAAVRPRAERRRRPAGRVERARPGGGDGHWRQRRRTGLQRSLGATVAAALGRGPRALSRRHLPKVGE
jgi:hypothetical protein